MLLHAGFAYYSLKSSASMILLYGKENLALTEQNLKPQEDPR